MSKNEGKKVDFGQDHSDTSSICPKVKEKLTTWDKIKGALHFIQNIGVALIFGCLYCFSVLSHYYVVESLHIDPVYWPDY